MSQYVLRLPRLLLDKVCRVQLECLLQQPIVQESRCQAMREKIVVVPPPSSAACLGMGHNGRRQLPKTKDYKIDKANINIQGKCNLSIPTKPQHPRPCQTIGRSTRRDTKHNSESVAGSADQVEFTGTSCDFLLRMQSGVFGRNDCTRTVGPHSRRNHA